MDKNKEEHMQVVKRQFDQLVQMLGKSEVPISLLKLVERGNKVRQPVFGGGYMNGPDLVHVIISWEASALDKKTVVKTHREYREYKPEVKDKPKVSDKPEVASKVVRKKKVAAAHG